MTTPGSQPNTRLHFDGAMLSNVGAVRTLNEDVVLYTPAPAANGAAGKGALALVADGMGGHAAGEIASALAAETIRRSFYELEGPVPMVLASAFAAANRAILNWAEAHSECAGMGTTCTAVVLQDEGAWLAHIGDSRAYLLRDRSISQLSKDQTLVAQLIREGKLSEKDAANSPVSNVILQALGMGAEISPLIWSEPLPLKAGDVILLCTDGLSGLVSDDVIADIAGRLPPAEACEALVNAAIAAGGHDNVSVGVLHASADAKPAASGSAKSTRPLKALDIDDTSRATRRLTIPTNGGRNA
jgi:protein phosphatase